MKICFYARSGQTVLFAHMGKILEQRYIESVYVCQDKYEETKVRKIFQEAKIYNLTEYFRENWDLFNKEQFDRIVEEYVEEAIWEMFYSDRYLNTYKYNDSIKFIIGHILFYENIFHTEKPTIFLNEAIAHYSSYSAHMVGKFANVKYVGFIVSRDTPFETFYYHNDPYQTNHNMIKLYDQGIFSEAEIEQAKQFIENMEADRSDKSHRKVFDRGNKFKLSYLRHLYYFAREILDKRNYDKINYMNYKVNINRSFDLLKTYIRSFTQRKYFCRADFKQKYYFFPLHYQPEATTLVCASKYENQLFAIDQLAKSLPLDSILYVKEHYVYLGHKKTSFYKEIEKYPNVKLIDPHTSTHMLIKNSVGVITLTGTVGFEAIIKKIPVFVLGHVFYDFFPEVTKIGDIFQERDRFKDPLNIDSENVIKFVCAYKKSLLRGCVHSKSTHYRTKENAENMVETLLENEKQ